jgi:tripartite-type tricarboxylate transporter receptor subunit TctC
MWGVLLRVMVFLAMCGSVTHAQACSNTTPPYPSKPIRWILPFPPGGPSDAVARILGQRLSERLQQPVLIDNRPGGSGSLGLTAAARAAPDGYTIVFGAPGSVVINAITHQGNFDPLRELTPVSRLATFAFVLITNPQIPAANVQELLALAKAEPGALTCGAGATLQQLACEMLKLQGRVDVTTIPYKGGAPAMNDLLAGRISFMFEVPNVALPQATANRVRAIATTQSHSGSGPFADLPTTSDTLPGFEIESWFGVLAPPKTPSQIIERLSREFAAVLAEEDVRKRLTDAGLTPAPGSPEVFAEVMRRDFANYAKMIRDAGIRIEP